MAVALPTFSDWLGDKLKALNTDETVFGDYISAILDGDESAEEKREALQDLLGEIIPDQSGTELCAEITHMWSECKKGEMRPLARSQPLDVDIQLKELADKHCLQTKEKRYSEEEKKIRDAILAQYAQTSDDENGGDEMQTRIEKNTNAQQVAQLEKEKRENARQEAQRKKEKDKEDRDKQRQLRDEKKEKRKTQKGERRR